MAEHSPFDLVDALTHTAARLDWEAVSAETLPTHVVMAFRNPAEIARLSGLAADLEEDR